VGDLAYAHPSLVCCEIVSGVEFTIDRLGGKCPAQAVGHLADERRFYFRARHGVTYCDSPYQLLSARANEPVPVIIGI
jgi:hypothetical protein